jgi:hypothetical protein
VTANGRRRPQRPRIEIASTTASASEAAAIVAALEQFLVETAPVPAPVAGPSPWQTAALGEGLAARQIAARRWGSSPGGWRRS